MFHFFPPYDPIPLFGQKRQLLFVLSSPMKHQCPSKGSNSSAGWDLTYQNRWSVARAICMCVSCGSAKSTVCCKVAMQTCSRLVLAVYELSNQLRMRMATCTNQQLPSTSCWHFFD
eukprot:TRINITY_DN68128_c7_g5_i1.p2 TRINITY_DN68128_c7_g5~~TRINITY_DN68128_c7_g5_i1.p2  ORF type:complete len:116 (-),score=6.46 TRINITY_DN68128_c7_g5_i1:615-962(-)